MVSKKISILVVLILSTIYNSESRGTYSSSQVFNQHPNNNQECFCFASSAPYNVNVPEIIKPSRGLERLVIYLYRDMDTYQIKMHTPNQAMQKKIPDLRFEYGDELVVVSGETMQMIFDKSPEKIIKEYNGTVLRKEIEPKLMHNIYMDMPSNEENDDRMAINEEPEKSSMHRQEIFSEAFPSNNKFNNINDRLSGKHSEYNQNVPNAILSNNIHRYQKQKFGSHVVPFNYDVNTFYNQRVKDNISYKKNTVLSNHDMHKFSEPLNVPSFSKGVVPHAIPSENIPVFRSTDSHAIPHKQNGGQFGEWIVKQMKTFNDDHKIEGHQIDSNAIGNFILQILHKNGMHVTDKGVIADSQGKVVNIHNFSLIPILIGDTTSHDQFLQRDTEALSSQTLPYLQAILVVTSQPLKILGVIPLGKTFLPSSTLGTISNIWKTILPQSVDEKTSFMHKPKLQNISETKKSGLDKESDSKENFDDLRPYSYQDNNVNKYTYTNEINHNHHKRKSSENQHYEDNYDTEEGNSTPLNYFGVDGSENEDLSEKDNSNVERMFLPALHEEPSQMLSRDHDASFNFIPHTQSTKMHVHSMMPDNVEWSFRSQSVPLGGLAHSYFATPYKNQGISRKHTDPMKTLQKLSVMDIPSTRKNMPFSFMPNPMSPNGNVPILPSSRNAKYLGNYGVSTFNALPLSAGIGFKKPLGSPLHFGFGSRSENEIPVPEAAETEDSAKNGKEVFDFLVEGDDDGDDGDFRIIGGNAATGSGTPLSNKGRSGYIY